jgi:hypothetical protein
MLRRGGIMEQTSSGGDVTAELRTLLLLSPEEAGVGRLFVVTLSTDRWVDVLPRDGAKICDLSTMFGRRSPSQPLAIKRVHFVTESLVRGGWPRRSLAREFRSDLRSPAVVDLAILGPDRHVLVALEIKPSSILFAHSIRQRLEMLRSTVQASWVCVTDGDRYYCLNTVLGTRRTFERPPTSSELGIALWDGPDDNEPADHAEIVSPSTATELTQEAEIWRPERVILDFTLPFDRTLEPAYLRHDTSSPFWRLLPDDIHQLPGDHIEMQEALMVWAAHLSATKWLSAVISQGLPIERSNTWVCDYLCSRLPVCAVLGLPPDTLPTTTSPTASIAYLGTHRQHVYTETLMSRGDLLALETRPWFQEFRAWLTGETEHKADYGPNKLASAEDTSPTVNSSAPRPQDRNPTDPVSGWPIPKSNPALAKTLRRLQKVGSVALGDVCEVICGIQMPRSLAPSGLPVFETFSSDGSRLELSQTTRVDPAGLESSVVDAGDIILKRGVRHYVSAVLYSEQEQGLLSGDMVALRVIDRRVTPEYLLEYLRSATAQQLLEAFASGDGDRGTSALEPDALQHLPVPIVDRDRLDGFLDLQRTERVLRTKADELESRRRMVFDEVYNRDALSHALDELRTTGKLLSIGLEALSSVDYRIAVAYPFPIAYGYRQLASFGSPHQLVREQFRLAENLLAFLAYTALSVVQDRDRQQLMVGLQDPLSALAHQGLSMGHWMSMLTNTCQILDTYQDHGFARALCALHAESKASGDLGGHADALIGARNKWGHMKLGLGTDEEARQAAESMESHLRACVEHLEFFADYPIRKIESIDDLNVRGRSVFRCLVYRGDHPALPREVVPYDGAPEGNLKQVLYLDVGESHWIPLNPFIVPLRCEQHRQMETWFIEKWNPEKQEAELKGFEHEHKEALKSTEVGTAVAAWLAKGACADQDASE